MKFKLQNYNEFRENMAWHDYVSVIINEFPIVLVRRYEWLLRDKYSIYIQFFGFCIFRRTYSYVEEEVQ